MMEEKDLSPVLTKLMMHTILYLFIKFEKTIRNYIVESNDNSNWRFILGISISVYWWSVDERLVKRGKFLLSLDFI